MIYRHSKLVGQRTDIFRNVEDSYTAKQGDLCLSRGRVHVDIGSGSSPLPTFLVSPARVNNVCDRVRSGLPEAAEELRESAQVQQI